MKIKLEPTKAAYASIKGTFVRTEETTTAFGEKYPVYRSEKDKKMIIARIEEETVSY